MNKEKKKEKNMCTQVIYFLSCFELEGRMWDIIYTTDLIPHFSHACVRSIFPSEGVDNWMGGDGGGVDLPSTE